MDPELHDVVIIGGGPGGYVAALRAAQLGMTVAVVEREALGGMCLNWGCIPSKALLHSAEVLITLQEAEPLGVYVDGVRGDYGQAIRRARSVAERQARGVAFLMRKYGVTVVSGQGRLTSSTDVLVETSGSSRVLRAARGIILATGSRVRPLGGLVPDGQFIFSSRDVWGRENLPQSVLLLGGGPISCEFATVFHAFGAKVTIVEALPRLLPREDASSSEALTRAFRKRGIEVVNGMILDGIEPHGSGINVRLVPTNTSTDQSPIERTVASVMLNTGFAPNTEGIGLETCGVALDARGYISVDTQMRTNVPGVYAIGDVTGVLPLAHVAEAQGQVAAETIAGHTVFPLDYDKIPRAVYSDPQVASTGSTEEHLRSLGIPYRVVTAPFQPNGKARAIGTVIGHIKLLVAESGEILGAHMVGPEVTELIGEVTLAQVLEATPLELGRSVHPHPSLSEVLAEAALEWAGMTIAT